jgi:N-acetylmuramoyl-L-alanine amidase
MLCNRRCLQAPLIATNQTSTKCLAMLLATFALLSASFSGDEKQLSVYSPVAIYTLPVLERNGRDYIGLLELLEPLGRVTSEAKGQVLKLRYNAVDAEFVAGKTRARIRGQNFDFSNPVLIENSRGLVPFNSLGGLLPRFIGTQVTFREGARRLFIGDVGIQISFKMEASNAPLSNPPRLALNFSAPVNPTISTEPGKLRMVFRRDPVVSPGSQSITFDNKVITQASYSENNGEAELDIAANGALMANFSSDRKTIVISAAAQTPTGSQSPAATAQSSATSSNTSGTGGNINNASFNVHRIIAIVDPAHGGDERGAALTDTLAEKEVTLGFARLLRHELETRGFAVNLLRDADTTLTADQRAATANFGHPGVYICLHAVSEGSGALVYTSLIPAEEPSKGIFHAWNAAQAPVLPVSRTVSTAIVDEMQKRQFPVQTASASLRPLNNVVMPAVAVELAPGPNGVSDLTSANYQQRAAAAIADAIVSVRDRLEVQP